MLSHPAGEGHQCNMRSFSCELSPPHPHNPPSVPTRKLCRASILPLSIPYCQGTQAVVTVADFLLWWACVYLVAQKVSSPVSCSKLPEHLKSFHRKVTICYFSFNPINMATVSSSTESRRKKGGGGGETLVCFGLYCTPPCSEADEPIVQDKPPLPLYFLPILGLIL